MNTAEFFGPRFALLRLLLGAGMISFSAVFVSLVSVGAIVSAYYRVLFGGVVLLLIVLWRGRVKVPVVPRLAALLAAGLFFAADLGLWHQSILYIGPGLSTLLGNFQVFFMALAGVLLFREPLTRELLIGIPLAVLGLFLIVGWEGQFSGRELHLGVILGLLTAVMYTGFMLSMRRAASLPGGGDALANLALASLITALLLGLFAGVRDTSLALHDPVDAVWLVSYGIVGQVVGWLFITSALPQVRAATAGLALLLQPVLSYVWDILFFDRELGGVQAAGALLTLFAIFLGSVPRGRKNRDARAAPP